MSTTTLELHATPPSANRSRGREPRVQHRLKRQLQADLEGLLMASDLPRERAGSADCSATLRFPVRRRRDVVNYWLLDKALGDALVNGRWLPDDTPEHYHLRIGFDPEPGPARTIITITLEDPVTNNGTRVAMALAALREGREKASKATPVAKRMQINEATLARVEAALRGRP